MSLRLPVLSGNTLAACHIKFVRLSTELRSQLSLGSRVLLGLWLLLMILIPHILPLADRSTFLLALTLSIVLQVCLVLSLLVPALSLRSTVASLTWILAFTWLAEFIGHRTGLPFGRYSYTDALGPHIGGVPMQVPAAWLMMLPPAWAVGTAICSKRHTTDDASKWRQFAAYSVVSGLAFTAWDLFLDPQMVAWGVWLWERPGIYFGVPAINFFGWALTAFIVLFGLSRAFDSSALPTEALLLVYTTVWVLNSLGLGLFFDQPGAAAAGFVGMGVFVVLAWRQVLFSHQ
ncbi:MAG: carotenoid biosynthesis protein [Caldilineaceae bacterium]|nr:carotenoid biosynthesis protein [Caldilineaceae bacterium]